MKKNVDRILQKNDCIPLSIVDMTAEGAGIGKYQGMAVFVPLSAVGDVLTVRILKVQKNIAFGKIEAIITPSEYRVDSDCPYFQKCGGCTYRHISYEAELAVKEKRVLDALTRIGKLTEVPIAPIVGADCRNHYRNKGLLPLGTAQNGTMEMGFYATHSHRIVDCKECLLQPKEFTQIMQIFRDWQRIYGDSLYSEATHKGNLRRLFIRKGDATGEIMVCIVTKNGNLSHCEELIKMLVEAVSSIKSIVLNRNPDKTNVALGLKNRTVYGKDSITDKLCGLQFSISPLSFYQVNHAQAQRLYTQAALYAALTGKEVLLDLYCGTGTIGLSMAHRAKKLIGVEVVADAVENARANARDNGIHNAEFICADAAQAAEQLKKQGQTPDVILLDPPRKGCTPELLSLVANFEPEKIIYISCDPATLARDLYRLTNSGYTVQACTPFDLFPATTHVETCVLLSHKNPQTSPLSL